MAKKFRKLSHSWYECKYHIVFCPKYRYPILKGEVAKLCQTGNRSIRPLERPRGLLGKIL